MSCDHHCASRYSTALKNWSTAMNDQVKTPRMPLNGVNTPTFLATINLVAAQPELARFQFRASNEWISGTHSQSMMSGFHGACQEQTHVKTYVADSDHPAVLCGEDRGPTPVEWVLHALASCLVAGVANIAAVRGIKLKHVRAAVTGDIDLRGILGISPDVRNGFSSISVAFAIDGDCDAEKLHQIVEQAARRSAVLDMLSNGLAVSVSATC
jgi:uncharacterized OsmC-like protein